LGHGVFLSCFQFVEGSIYKGKFCLERLFGPSLREISVESQNFQNDLSWPSNGFETADKEKNYGSKGQKA
jgi:hypothetical protein